MPTSCNTHDYDGKLREKWFEMRPMLIEKYLSNCLSFDDTIKQIEEWLEKKYFNVKRIGRARRSIRILTSQRTSNFDSRNDIDVEELLPILWDRVKNQEDIHDTFYEQLCDITGGSCSQGRSTRLFQFLFLFDLPTNTEPSTEQESPKKDNDNTCLTSDEQEESKSHEEQQSHLEDKIEENQQSHLEEKTEEKQQSNHLEEKTEDKQQMEQEPDQMEQINSSPIQTE
jgi:hypothetical protein